MSSPALDDLIQPLINVQIPGATVAVIHHGALIHYQGYGVANLEWPSPVTPHTVFQLGSLTKPFFNFVAYR